MIDGPLGSMWYDVLEQYVCPDEPLSTKAVLGKTALDQVVYATLMTGQQQQDSRRTARRTASTAVNRCPSELSMNECCATAGL